MPGAPQQLSCPTCAASYPDSERFCSRCHMPLVYAGLAEVEAEVPERRRRARLIKPQLAEGRLVRVTGARNLVEAEFIQALLLEQGVPSVLQRARGFDVPDFLAAGPRDVMVAESGLDVARDVLLQGEPGSAPRVPVPVAATRVRLIAAVLLAVVILAVVALIAGGSGP